MAEAFPVIGGILERPFQDTNRGTTPIPGWTWRRFHEMGHVWAYNHTSGEICLTETLLLHGDTHGLVDDSCVAFHEGWAEFYANEMERALLGVKKLVNPASTVQPLDELCR